MRRRALLVAAGATTASLAGCTTGRSQDDTPTATPTSTPTPTPEPCEVDREPPRDPGGELEPRELPERPDEWTDQSVGRFVREYEAAYRQRRVIEAETTAFGHSESVESIEETEADYRVRLETNFYYNEETDDGRTVHADSPVYNVGYLVAEDRLLRAEAESYDAEPDFENARTMECW